MAAGSVTSVAAGTEVRETAVAQSDVAQRAATRPVTIRVPKEVVRGTRLVVRGKARGVKRVRVQERRQGSWVTVRRPRVNNKGQYRARWKKTGRPRVRTFRTVSARGTSVTKSVRVLSRRDGCGPRQSKGGGYFKRTYWRCTFVDDFNGTELDRTKWMPQTHFSTGTDLLYACYYDSPRNISVSNGNLHLTLRSELLPKPCDHKKRLTALFSSGMVSTYRRFSQQYGKFEARYKVKDFRQRGLQEAFWLWPDDRYSDGTVWPEAGEIDIGENYSRYPDIAIPFLHYTKNDNGGPIPGLNTAWDCAAKRGVYNTYTLVWSATRMEILINGRSCLVNTSGDKAFRKPYILAFTQALGTYGNENLLIGTQLPATMSVDYMRVWN
ncbi:glycoside hydrolase family 16 protein [Nocardioides limicola]|uniref:glycoside hydrolase family 16 protein n=1 Tax=Nocardioides limicola TaxID=2803368 RepID=UPI00193AF402|nr:glycoside hydrolase family 16 protein [Nocardioides sp. DJM-14]